jgi:hypothetical protein
MIRERAPMLRYTYIVCLVKIMKMTNRAVLFLMVYRLQIEFC